MQKVEVQTGTTVHIAAVSLVHMQMSWWGKSVGKPTENRKGNPDMGLGLGLLCWAVNESLNGKTWSPLPLDFRSECKLDPPNLFLIVSD